MARVLLTGGNGFVATHVLDSLLSRGYSVAVTVRSREKGNKILARYSNAEVSQITIAVVPDFTEPRAFDECLKSSTFDAILHVASPFSYAVSDIQNELLDPSIVGTTQLLKAVKQHSPTVKKVILTSSFAAILNNYKPNTWTEHTYTEDDWNPLAKHDAFQTPHIGYRVSKIYAERAAWDFMAAEKPAFSLVALCPTLAFGPVLQPLDNLNSLNTSSQRIYDFMSGKCKNKMPDTGASFFLWIDVRDLAVAHVNAIEAEEAANKRYLLTAGYFCNKEICQTILNKLPEYANQLPDCEGPEGGYPPEGVYKFDNRRATNELGLTYRTLDESVTDAVLSLRRAALVN